MNCVTTVLRKMMLMSMGLALTEMVAVPKMTVVSRSPIHFKIANPPCLVVPATLTGKGEMHLVIRSSLNTDGLYRLEVHEVLQGTASDSLGNEYTIHDIDKLVIDGSATATEETPPFTLVGTGKVALISKGRTPNIKLFMFINWQVNADGSVTDLGSVFEGDLSCDPSSEL